MAVETYTIHLTNKYNRPPPPSTVVLHSLDLLSAPIQIRNRRFFHRLTITTSDLIDKLRSSLAVALELYSPVAGTVVEEPELPSKYKNFEKVFSKIEADKLLPHRPYDQSIPIVEGATVPFDSVYNLPQSELKS
ncbi:hypothetical protein BGX26_007712, partial [Mortierella sp. AD094]